MSTTTSDIGYTKLFEIDIVTPHSSTSYTLLLKHHKWVQKEIKDLEKACVIQRSLSPYESLTVVVARNTTPSSPLQEI